MTGQPAFEIAVAKPLRFLGHQLKLSPRRDQVPDTGNSYSELYSRR